MKNKKNPTEMLTWLTQMVSLISNHGLWKILVSIVTLAFSIVIINVALDPSVVFETWEKYISTKHTAGIEYRINIDPKINKIITEMRDSLRASRVFILEPHNGTYNLNGLPFWYLNMTQEVVKNDLFEIKRHYNDIEANDFPLAYKVYREHEWAGTVNDLALIDKRLSKLMIANDAEYLVIVSMNGVNNFLGFIGITFIEGDTIPNEKLIDRYLHDSAQRIGNLLDGYGK